MTSACLACTPKKLASKVSKFFSFPVRVGRPYRPETNSCSILFFSPFKRAAPRTRASRRTTRHFYSRHFTYRPANVGRRPLPCPRRWRDSLRTRRSYWIPGNGRKRHLWPHRFPDTERCRSWSRYSRTEGQPSKPLQAWCAIDCWNTQRNMSTRRSALPDRSTNGTMNGEKYTALHIYHANTLLTVSRRFARCFKKTKNPTLCGPVFF